MCWIWAAAPACSPSARPNCGSGPCWRPTSIRWRWKSRAKMPVANGVGPLVSAVVADGLTHPVLAGARALRPDHRQHPGRAADPAGAADRSGAGARRHAGAVGPAAQSGKAGAVLLSSACGLSRRAAATGPGARWCLEKPRRKPANLPAMDKNTPFQTYDDVSDAAHVRPAPGRLARRTGQARAGRFRRAAMPTSIRANICPPMPSGWPG